MLPRHGLPTRALARLGVAVAVMAITAPVFGCDTKGPTGRIVSASAPGLCPRPQAALGEPPQFSAQEQEIRALRRQAFGGDFFAQIDLARRYAGRDARQKNLEDPTEAATWFELALANTSGYAPIVAGANPGAGDAGDCRAAERQDGADALEDLLARMSSDERQDVRDRVTYVLSTQGSTGFRTLARLHDGAFGAFGDPLPPLPPRPGFWDRLLKRSQPPPPSSATAAGQGASTLFLRNDVDVYLYNYLAAQAGDVGGFVVLKDYERASAGRSTLGPEAEAKAKRWVPPFEFYPPGAPDSGVPHSDESAPPGEAYSAALARLDDLPFQHIGEALAYLRAIPRPVRYEREVSPAQIQAFQAMLGRPVTGALTQLERLRAVQYAAIDGSPRAQLALAVMYAEGIGVLRDYARAFHWFSEAEKQGSPEAKYAMSTYFSLGVSGVADQDKAAAVVYQLDAALAGFRPSAQRLREVLAQVGRAPPATEIASSRGGYR